MINIDGAYDKIKGSRGTGAAETHEVPSSWRLIAIYPMFLKQRLRRQLPFVMVFS